MNILNPGPRQVLLPPLPMRSMPLKRGDVFCHILAGGGGYGDPLERDPQMVCEDVLDEKFTLEFARREYGVVIDPATMRVDVDATHRLRRQLRATDSGGGARAPRQA